MLSFLNGRMLAPLSREASLPPPPSPHGRFIWAVDDVGGREAGGGTLRLGHEWRRKGNKVKGERPSRPKVSVPVPAARTASCPSGSKRPWPFRREGAGGGTTACCAGRRGMDQGKLGARAECLLATSSQQSLSATRLSRASLHTGHTVSRESLSHTVSAAEGRTACSASPPLGLIQSERAAAVPLRKGVGVRKRRARARRPPPPCQMPPPIAKGGRSRAKEALEQRPLKQHGAHGEGDSETERGAWRPPPVGPPKTPPRLSR